MCKRRSVKFLACIPFVLGLQAGASGAEKTPLPSIFFQAKTIHIVSDLDENFASDRAFDELKKWGRYQIVENPDEADLVLVLTAREDLTGLERNQGANGYVTVYGEKSTASGSDASRSTDVAGTVSQKSTTAAFFDRQTGRKVWSETRAWRSAFGSAAGPIVKDLRKRVEAAEKDPAKR